MMEPSLDLFGLSVHGIDRQAVVDEVLSGLEDGRGGWILTPNVDLVQQAAEDPKIRALYGRASLRVTDGMPLCWMARLAGHPLPDRVAGSDLVWLLARALAPGNHKLFLLGGDEGVAEKAGGVFESMYPGVQVVGHLAPRIQQPPDAAEIQTVAKAIRAAEPNVVFVAFGSPKTEYLIDALRSEFPKIWWLGCGISLSFVTGDVTRAPRWVQRIGFEWFHRMLQEPGRLGGRYLRRNLPFVIRGLWAALRGRLGAPDPAR